MEMTINTNQAAWQELQQAFEGEAERVGWQSEEDVVDFCKEIRREMQERQYGYND